VCSIDRKKSKVYDRGEREKEREGKIVIKRE
jgi:hypothetical protein